jgi:hypothetical protein
MAGQFSAANLQELARIITLCYFYFRSLRSVNKFLFGAGYIRRRRDQPSIGSIPEGRMVFGKSARLIAQAETVCVISLCFVCWLSLASSWPGPAEDGLIESTEARDDIALSTDPGIAFWRAARPVYAEGPARRNLVSHRTEVRSRWRPATPQIFVFTFVEIALCAGQMKSTDIQRSRSKALTRL